jgi:hypothetical protein
MLFTLLGRLERPQPYYLDHLYSTPSSGSYSELGDTCPGRSMRGTRDRRRRAQHPGRHLHRGVTVSGTRLGSFRAGRLPVAA